MSHLAKIREEIVLVEKAAVLGEAYVGVAVIGVIRGKRTTLEASPPLLDERDEETVPLLYRDY